MTEEKMADRASKSRPMQVQQFAARLQNFYSKVKILLRKLKKKHQRNEETSINLRKLQEIFNISISRNSFQGSNNCHAMKLFSDIICYIHNTNKQARMNNENDD